MAGGSAPEAPGKGGAFAIRYFKRMGVWGLKAPAGVQGTASPAGVQGQSPLPPGQWAATAPPAFGRGITAKSAIAPISTTPMPKKQSL